MSFAYSIASPGCVYFVRATESRRIKIGFTRELGRRLMSLATGSPEPLQLACVIDPATLADEKALHHRFRAARLHGEWFAPAAAITEYIDAVVAESGPPFVPPYKPVRYVRLAKPEQSIPAKRRRGRPPVADGSAECLKRESFVARWLAGDATAVEIGLAAGVSERTLRRWARSLAAKY